MPNALLSVKNLKIVYSPTRSRDEKTEAVKGVSFKLSSNERFCLVGESGSGKTSIAMALARLLPETTDVRGEVTINGVSIYNTSQSELRNIRRKQISFIFQDSTGSLIPNITVGKQVSRVLAYRMEITDKKNVYNRARTLLQEVGLADIDRIWSSYPQQLSGGMCQRVMIAMALCVEPSLVIADEPTSALDVLTQQKILDLIMSLQKKYQFALFYITHDMRISSHYSDKVGVMKEGSLIDIQETEHFFSNPSNAYSAQLLESARKLSI